MDKGWIKFHRKTLENPIVCKDSDHLALWIYLLAHATHTEYDAIFKNKRITLKPGQLLTGRKSIGTFLKVNENKVQRILKAFENEQQIEQQTSNQNRLISILNWDLYQSSEQQSEQQVNNKRTTSEQRVNTNKNERTEEHKNERNNTYRDSHLEWAKILKSKILDINPKNKCLTANIEKWADDIRIMQERDKRSDEELHKIIEYIFNQDDFWKTVIQSPAGLRKHWDKIWPKVNQNKGTVENIKEWLNER